MPEEHGVVSPLLPSQTSDEVILNVSNSPSASNQFHDENHLHDVAHMGSSNPFRFIGCDELSVPPQTTVDPFRNDTPDIDGVYEWVKIVLCLPIVVVRLVLFSVSVLVGYIVTKLALIGFKDKQEPMPRWRCRVMWIPRFCARCILFSFGYQCITRKGRPAPREIAPIIGDAGDICRQVFRIIKETGGEGNKGSDTQRRASCDRFPQVLIFPEGTTSNGKNLLSFQLGAFYPGYPVQPVIIRYPHVHFDQSWCDVSLGKLIFRMLTQFHNFFEVEYLPTILPMDGKKRDSAHFAKRTSYAMATALNVVQTKHTYGDSILHMKAQEAKQDNPLNYMVELARVESLFRISNSEAAGWLDKFLSMNPDPSSQVQYNDFLRVLKLKSCPISKEIFEFIDVEKNGTIKFREFLYGLVHVMKQPLFREACELAFVECGGLVNGHIIEQQLQDSIQAAIPGCKENEVRELFLLFDHDNNGFVSKDDFVTCLRRNPLLIAFFLPHLQCKNLLGVNKVLEKM